MCTSPSTVLLVATQAFVVALGIFVLLQVRSQLLAAARGVDGTVTADEYYSSELSVTRLEDLDGDFQARKYGKGRCGYGVYQAAHFVPAAVWSIILPLQLWPGLRRAMPVVHRILGRVFLVCSLLLGLSSFVFVLCGSGTAPILDGPAVLGGAAFLVTGGLAYWHAAARRIELHRVWITRHLGWGLGIYTMRLIYVAAFWAWFGGLDAPGWSNDDPRLIQLRKEIFGYSGIAAFAITPIVAELSLAIAPGKARAHAE